MSAEAEEQAAQQDGSPLSEFGWSCNDYAAYITALRNGE
jgi:hypothetical protein